MLHERIAYQLVQESEYLTGDEKKTWGKDIMAAATKPIVINPVAQAAEIIMINRKIRDKEDPQEVRKYIVLSQNLNKEDKEQYINKLETKLSVEIADGRRLGYRDIEDIIFPPSQGMIGKIEDMLKTPLQTHRRSSHFHLGCS